MLKHGTASEMSKEQFREFAGAVLRCLPDDLDTEITQGWIKNAESLRRVLREVLSPNGKPIATFPVWKTLSVGGVSKDELVKRLKKKIDVSRCARDLMNQPAFTTSAEPHEISLARGRVRDLGFTEMPTTEELFDEERLAGRGLGLCEPEDAIYVALADTDQPRGDWYWVAMPPIAGSGGIPSVFSVERCIGRYVVGRLRLLAVIAHPDDRWDLGRGIVFRLRK